MGSDITQQCMQKDLINNGGVTVLTNTEIKPLLLYNESFTASSYAIIVVQKGSLVFQRNFVKYTMLAHDMYMVAPGSLCELYELSEDVEFICLGFRKEYLKEQAVFLSSVEINRLFSSDWGHKFSLDSSEFEDMFYLLRSLRRKVQLSETTSYHSEIVKHSFLSVLYEVLILYRKYHVFVPVKVSRQEELTASFLNLLSERFKLEKKVQYYAKELYVTSRHLSQVVKQVTGKTAGEIIDEMVIKEAKALLSSRVMNVAQVADELRFSDQSFFGKFFKKHTGISPSIYRSDSSITVKQPF